MTKVELTKLCRVWQERLLLQDWTIQVHIDKALKLFGCVEWDTADTWAKITIRAGGADVMESSLVHELLHLRLRHCELNDELEVSINLLARSYIKVFRRTRRAA